MPCLTFMAEQLSKLNVPSSNLVSSTPSYIIVIIIVFINFVIFQLSAYEFPNSSSFQKYYLYHDQAQVLIILFQFFFFFLVIPLSATYFNTEYKTILFSYVLN